VFLIIFGTRGVTRKAEKGEFHCPCCGSGSVYSLKRVRRFFTLYFVPLVPLDKICEFIECQGCQGTYQTQILDHDPAQQQKEFEAEFHRAARRVLVLMMLADGEIDPEERKVLGEVLAGLTGKPVSQDQIDTEIRLAQHEQLALDEYLATVTPSLNETGKEMVMRAALCIAAADGRLEPEEASLLEEIREALQMRPAHFRGILAEMALKS
jgi:tellurite resistance protein